MALSPCGKYLIATDTQGGIAIWNEDKNKGKEHTLWKFYCVLPRYHCPATALSFQNKPCLLVAVYADHKVSKKFQLNIKSFV